MRIAVSALFALALLVGSGCDSSDDDEVTLDAQYYVGTWRIVSASDGSGDRTALINAALDDLAITFRSAGTFRLDADFNEAINGSGTADITTEGTYQAQPSVPAVILSSGGFAATFQASAVDSGDDDRLRLTAPAAILNQLLQGLPFQFQNDASVVIERQ